MWEKDTETHTIVPSRTYHQKENLWPWLQVKEEVHDTLATLTEETLQYRAEI